MGTAMDPVPAPDTLRLIFEAISTATTFTSSFLKRHPSLRAAADLDIHVSGSPSTNVAHLCSSPCTIVLSMPLSTGTSKSPALVGALSIELFDPTVGEIVSIAAVPPALFKPSTGTVKVALMCPDSCRPNGTLVFQFLRIGPRLIRAATAVAATSDSSTQRIPLVTAGLCASGSLSTGPASITMGDVRVSRTVLPLKTAPGAKGNPLALRVCAGDRNALGGRADLNALAAAAVATTVSANVVVLATDDVEVATVLSARAPTNLPVVWLGSARCARALGLHASAHDEGSSVLQVSCEGGEMDDELTLVVPPDLFNNDDATLPRRTRSVTWADQIVAPAPVRASSWQGSCEKRWTEPLTGGDKAAAL